MPEDYLSYGFLALERPLDEAEQASLRKQAGRSCQDPRTLLVDCTDHVFRGDARRLVERHFDVGLARSRRGDHQILFRAAHGTLSAQQAHHYGLEAWDTDTHTVLAVRCAPHRTGRSGGCCSLDDLALVREELSRGSRVPLYLAWLASLGDPDAYDLAATEVLEDEFEPAVPPGLDRLSPSLTAFTRLLGVNPRLLATARAGTSGPARPLRQGDLVRWLAGLPDADKDRLVLEAIRGEASGQLAYLRRRFSSRPLSVGSRRSVADLLRTVPQRHGQPQHGPAALRSAAEPRGATGSARGGQHRAVPCRP
ncbi:hypothetical protein AB0Q95_35970 [Streptomyces sp. NPDC059900]|uniref:hypothetical protein n=1 Tax=Streptomyces sp. NPDC059900 TaxID=3155816 RepID=UPI0034404C1C